MKKIVEYSIITGRPVEVFESINRSLGQYKRNNSRYKIGITGRHPQSRFDEHLRNDSNWARMVVLYETTSLRYANNLEKMLIDHHWSYIHNQKPGGGSFLCEEGKNFLYVLLGN
ncbi:MAG: hypothetical protein V4543_02245 [Bacteroidota bacterium]